MMPDVLFPSRGTATLMTASSVRITRNDQRVGSGAVNS